MYVCVTLRNAIILRTACGVAGPFVAHCSHALGCLRTTTPSNAWQRGDEQNEDFVAVYRDFLRTDPARRNIPNFGEELDHAQQCIAENDGDDEEDVPVSCSSKQDDWMLCCRLNHRYAADTNSGTDSFD